MTDALSEIDVKRHAVVALAKCEIGDQQKGSPVVLGYWRDVGVLDFAGKLCNDWQIRQLAGCLKPEPGPGKEWCGVFALWCLRAANVAPADVHWKLGSGFARKYLKVTAAPEPGDVFIGPAPMYHHGIVESYRPRLTVLKHGKVEVTDPGELASIEGNTPNVRRRVRPAPQGFTYYSIAPWLKQALDLHQ